MKKGKLFVTMLGGLAFVLVACAPTVDEKNFPTTSAEALEAIKARGSLRVCSPGDYLPFALQEPSTQEWTGVDVDAMHSLADMIGVSTTFVKTTWPRLTDDFIQSCDLAVGGISITEERRQKVSFSIPTLSDGKIPLTLCQRKNEFFSHDQLNRPSTRLIEPRGGTNEKYVREHLPLASLTLTDDNSSIFGHLERGDFDVMITDRSEALYAMKHVPSLCAVNPQTLLTAVDKAYMLPKSQPTLQTYVDNWLAHEKEDGDYERRLSSWLTIPDGLFSHPTIRHPAADDVQQMWHLVSSQ